MEIKQLDQSYQGTPIHFLVKTDGYFHADVHQDCDSFGVMFRYTPFPKQKQFQFEDVLMSEWLDHPLVFGAFEDDQLTGFVEVNQEWNNRLRISNIFVEEVARKQGVGSKLMEYVKTYSRSLNIRGIILETQSYNVAAIRFYQKHGFQFLGCDLSAFSNEDVDHQEIRLEMCCYIKNS